MHHHPADLSGRVQRWRAAPKDLPAIVRRWRQAPQSLSPLVRQHHAGIATTRLDRTVEASRKAAPPFKATLRAAAPLHLIKQHQTEMVRRAALASIAAMAGLAFGLWNGGRG